MPRALDDDGAEPDERADRLVPLSSVVDTAGMAVNIRAQQDDDLPQLLVIWRSAVEAGHRFLTSEDIDWYGELVADYLPKMSDLRVAVRDDGRPVGFIAQEAGQIHMLFVAPHSQGTGVGSALLAHVSETEPILRLDVNEQNPTALAFYLARGFELVGRSEMDGQGRPFPLLSLARRQATS
jgi:putative acetyltransferase